MKTPCLSTILLPFSIAFSMVGNAQPLIGTWNGSAVSTYTQSALGIGTNIPIGHLEVLYCNDQENGLVVTKKHCGTMIIPPAQYNPSYDGATHPMVEWGGAPGIFTLPMSFGLTAYSTFIAKPLIWARTQNPTSFTCTSGAYTSQFIVTPYGKAGINIENPRATLDIKGLGGMNHPTLIVGRQKPGTNDRTSHVHLVNLLSENGYNNISQTGDQGLFFTDGNGTDGCNTSGSFVIAPWTEAGSTIGGIRISNLGNIDLSGEVKATKLTVDSRWWNDQVFSSSYTLPSLYEVENFIVKNHHLPNVPSEATVIKDGIEVADMLAIQMGKIEELTLYLIQSQKEIDALKKKIEELENTNR